MNPTIWLIRVQSGNGWEYGMMTNKEAALALAADLHAEGKYYTVGVYECNMIQQHRVS